MFPPTPVRAASRPHPSAPDSANRAIAAFAACAQYAALAARVNAGRTALDEAREEARDAVSLYAEELGAQHLACAHMVLAVKTIVRAATPEMAMMHRVALVRALLPGCMEAYDAAGRAPCPSRRAPASRLAAGPQAPRASR